jgi:hypothetical protein
MKKRKKSVPFINDSLSLFISCSLSLILISVFVLVDSERMILRGHKRGAERGMLIGDVPEDSSPKPERLFNCYEFEVDSSLRYLSLSENKISKLEEVLKDSDLPIPEEVIDYLKRRAACGYVSTNIEFAFKVDPVKDPEVYQNYIKAYVALKKSLQEISKDLVLEVTLEEI